MRGGEGRIGIWKEEGQWGIWVWVGELLLSQHGWMIGFNWYVYGEEEKMMKLLLWLEETLFSFIQYEKMIKNGQFINMVN
jgi:hypothetical protein